MTSHKSPRDVFIAAWKLGLDCLPEYASFFSRKDFTLPQMFACLVLRHFYNLSYRGVAALIKDSPEWRAAVDMERAPDHRTICDAFDKVMKQPAFEAMMDRLTACFLKTGLLDPEGKPLAIDSTYYESHHVSRHYEKRKEKAARNQAQAETIKQGSTPGSQGKTPGSQGKTPGRQASSTRSGTVRSLPKLAIAVVASCHFILAAWAGTGVGGDHPHFDDLLLGAWRRAGVRCVVADAGYDSHDSHETARVGLGVDSIIPPEIGRPSEGEPESSYRAEMKRAFADGSVKPTYGQRWQVETTNSMQKRNYGSALRARTPARREREMLLKVLVHNISI